MKYLDMLKSKKVLTHGTAKSKKMAIHHTAKTAKSPFDSKDSNERRHISEKPLVETIFEWPEWCTSDCEHWEAINLPKSGVTIGCVIKEADQEIWRRLDRMTACPRNVKCF